MRVTKTIREYIEKKVWEKIEVKYEAEKLEAERQDKVRNEILNAASEAAEKVYREAVINAAQNIDFLEIYEDRMPSIYRGGCLEIKDRCYTNSVHHWRDRARSEWREVVDNIVVTLELGGTKNDLDKMLSEI